MWANSCSIGIAFGPALYDKSVAAIIPLRCVLITSFHIHRTLYNNYIDVILKRLLS